MSLKFGGRTYSEALDGARLGTCLDKVRAIITNPPGRWFTFAELANKAEASEAGVSARLRDLRKPQFGAMKIESKRIGRGIWAYRQAPPTTGSLYEGLP